MILAIPLKINLSLTHGLVSPHNIFSDCLWNCTLGSKAHGLAPLWRKLVNLTELSTATVISPDWEGKFTNLVRSFFNQRYFSTSKWISNLHLKSCGLFSSTWMHLHERSSSNKERNFYVRNLELPLKVLRFVSQGSFQAYKLVSFAQS